MPTANNAVDTVVKNVVNAAAKAKATRKKSKETELKLKMRGIQRELEAIDKETAHFQELQKKQDALAARHSKLTGELATVKADLIKELGLGE